MPANLHKCAESLIILWGYRCGRPAAQYMQTMEDCVTVRVEDKCVLHLNTLCFEDEFGHHRWDIRLIKHDVRDTLQQRLHWSHTVHDETSAQETVVKQQKHHSWTHLKHSQAHTCINAIFIFIHIFYLESSHSHHTITLLTSLSHHTRVTFPCLQHLCQVLGDPAPHCSPLWLVQLVRLVLSGYIYSSYIINQAR